jgi:2-aminoethylphosphonate-pyruvate transaminase
MEHHPECDAVVFTSGKCLEGMPGIGFAVARIDRVLECEGNAGSWSFDLHDVYAHSLRSGWGCFRFTPPAQALQAFSVALDLHAREGGQRARLARYAEKRARALRRRAQPRPPPLPGAAPPGAGDRHRPPARPPGLGVAALRGRAEGARRAHQQLRNTEAPTFRVGCIGAVTPAEMRGAVAAMGEALEAMGVRERVAA